MRILFALYHPPPSTCSPLDTLDTLSLRSDNAAQFAKWPSWLQFLSESWCYCCQVFTSLIAASNTQCIFILSFIPACLPYSSNCFRGAWIQKTPEEFKNENTILIRIASWSSLETNLSNLFSLSLSSGRKWFYWRVKKIYAVLDCIVKWMNWNVFHKGYHFLQLESTANY